MSRYRAVWDGTVLAESDDTILVDGYRYFPVLAVRMQYLEPSAHHTVFGWKGLATYYNVVVEGRVNPNAAWIYLDPTPAARRIDDHIAFWHGVRVGTVDGKGSLREPTLLGRLRDPLVRND